MSKVSFPPPSLVSLSRKLDPRGRGLAPLVARPALPASEAVAPSARSGSVWAAVPAVLFLGLAGAFSHRSSDPITSPLSNNDNSNEPLPVVTLAQTMIVTADDGSGTPTVRLASAPQVLRGRLRQEGGVISGRAPLGGSVARVWVRRGQRVNVGDPVLQLSQGSRSRPAPRAQRAQTAAEAAQVAAAKQQDALNVRFANARTRLTQAQARVEAARQRVARATAVVRDLQTRQREGRLPSSNTVLPVLPDSKPENAAPAPPIEPPVVPETPTADDAASTQAAADRAEAARREAQVSKAASARRALVMKARNAQQEADRATEKAKSAEAAAKAAEATAQLKTQKVAEARATSDAVQAAFDAKQAKGSDVEAARAGVEEAQGASGEATTRATVARQEAERLGAAAASARDRSTKAAQNAAASLRSLQLADAAPEPPRRATRPRVRVARRRAKRRIARAPQKAPILAPLPATSNASVGQAARLVRDALAESEKAIADARGVQREVDNYQAQVQRTASRLGTTGKNLQSAQQNMLDRTIQTRLAAVRAPASGTVISVAPLSANVSPGEPIVMVSQPGGWEARFQDFEGIWRTLRPGMTLSALMPARVSLSTGVPANASGNSPGATVVLRVRAVVPPQRPNGPAFIRAGLATAPANRALREGRPVLCSIARPPISGAPQPKVTQNPNAAPVLRVPATALVRDEAGRYLIAVLSPEVPEEAPSPQNPDAANGGAADSAEPDTSENRPAADLDAALPDASVAPETNQPKPFAVDWREVTIKGGAGAQRDIVAGLLPGERIFLEPSRLRPAANPAADMTSASLRTVQRVLLSLAGTA